MSFRLMVLCCAVVLASFCWASESTLQEVLLPNGYRMDAGSLDDPQPDTIRYDNNTPALLNTGTNFWTRVRFNAPNNFQLRSIYFYSTNGDGGAEPCSIFVHAADGNNLGALLSTHRLPGSVGDFAWNDSNLPTPLNFAAGDSFYVVIGPCPGGQQTAGWHVIMDNANSGRSGYSASGHYGSYSNSGGDYMTRAGGAIASFSDLEAVETYNRINNGAPAFNFLTGATVGFRTLVSNAGNSPVDLYSVTWTVLDPNGAEVFNEEVAAGPINPGANATISTTTTFTASVAGEYMATSTVTADGDPVPENNATMVRFFAGGINRWYRYDDNQAADGYIGFTVGNGWGVSFKPTVYPARVETVRVDMNIAGTADLRIYLNDVTGMPTGNPLWSNSATVEAGWNAITVTPPVTIPNNGSFTLAYLYSGIAMGKDDNPPNDAEITNMGPISWQAADDGATWTPSSSGNWSMQAYVASPLAADEQPRVDLPSQYELSQNYPNPFNPSTEISFALPQAAKVKLAVYNTLGQEVAVLVNGTLEAGRHTVSFKANDLPAGVYLYRLNAGSDRSSYQAIRKMMLLK